MDLAQVSQIVGGLDRRFPEQDQGRVGDLPFRCLEFCGGAQPELVAQDSRHRIRVRVVGHLLPVAGDSPAVKFRGTDLAVHVRRDVPVILWAERARHLDLHRLRSRERLPLAGFDRLLLAAPTRRLAHPSLRLRRPAALWTVIQFTMQN